MFTIGELAGRTNLSVKTIRFYSDEGLLPPTDRTAAGYRLYDVTALARADLIRTLRELGLGLADIGRVLAGASTVPELARAHVDALDDRIRMLRHRRSVLWAVANRESELDEVRMMTRLASMPDDERKRVVDDFWNEVTADLDIDPEFVAHLRSAKPELPDDPAPEQLEAWIEFAELVGDDDFRALIREMFRQQARGRSGSDPVSDAMFALSEDRWQQLLDRAQQAVDAGTEASSQVGRALAGELAGEVTAALGTAADGVSSADIADRIAQGADARAERYWQLIARINGWPLRPSARAAALWLADALRTL
ncbi:MerR family transcriptional regulator [Saccharomonospora sp. CUA-673]|uniref:MerR family transcriptional regulator n=1 Tax=Saccharomonospora sp. CUA-673 TaxID=1904969 RepID=UPI00095D08B2|nr:MerR family transcriptional regulator [Saccharomonospora sp. CUA-673]OLT48433.1 MerR family transcriptional regulator [Saccharomonospora sp. CUA-673]